MALFQPSHVVPSTLSGLGNGVVASDDTVSISWQVNGNSAMTGFKIDIYTNDAMSKLVHSTGAISSGYGLPFFGTDSKGNQQTFVYAPFASWASRGLSDGKSYKLKITQYWNGGANHVVQYSESAFVTRTAPTVSISNLEPMLSTVSKTFNAVYSQAQGDAVNWVRWQLQNINGDEAIDIDDTGAINTAVLAYSYDGFLAGNTYRIMVTVETQSGVVASTDWQTFSVSYPETSTNGGIDLRYDPENECALLSWQKGTNIPGTASPPNGIHISPLGGLDIGSGTSVTWDTVDGEPMNFTPEYSAYWRGHVAPSLTMYHDLYESSSKAYEVTCSAISPDGNTMYLGTDDTVGETPKGSVLIYKKNNAGKFELQKTMSFSSPIYTVSCSPRNDTFLVGGKDTAIIYDTQTLEWVATLLSAIGGTVYASAYSPSGNAIIIGGTIGGYAEIYSIDGKEIFGWENITAGGALDGKVTSCAFVDDGNVLLLGGEFTSYCKVYDVSGTTLTFRENLSAGETKELDGAVTAIAATGVSRTKFVVCGMFSDKSYIYDVSNGSIIRSMSIPFQGTAYAAAWSPFGDKLIFVGAVGANMHYAAVMYCFYNGEAYQMAQVANGLSTTIALAPKGNTCLFSTDGKTLVVGGDFYGGAVLYTVNNDQARLVSFGSDLSLEYRSGMIFANANGKIASIALSNNTDMSQAMIGFIPGGIIVYNLRSAGTLISYSRRAMSYVQPTVSYVTQNGPQVSKFSYIAQGLVEFSGSYSPTRDFNTLFYTDFTSAELQAGTIAGRSVKNALYRISEGGSVLSSVYKFPTSVNRIRDFSVRSKERYHWEMFYVTAGDRYSAPIVSETLCKQFRAFTLIEATEDSQYPNVYHALRVWRFASNVTGWSASNNNTPTMLQNFTKYPLRQASAQNYKSGILQGLLSNAKNGVYQDTAKQMELLFAISQSLNTFFLRDIKGNLYMVHTNGPITQSMSTSSAQNEITVSVPWSEVGDASNVSIIQTPDDEGWENNEVLKASASVSASDGTANISYPANYSGTTFASNNFDMVAQTPVTMEQPDLEVINGNLHATL